MAFTRPVSALPVCARSTFTVSAPAALSAAASACGMAMPPATTVSGWLPMMRLSPSTNVGALAEIDAVREPDDFDVRRGGEEAFDQRQRLGAVDAVWASA